MTKFDLYIENSIKSENATRVRHFLKNTDKVYEQSTFDNGAKFKVRFESLKREINKVLLRSNNNKHTV